MDPGGGLKLLFAEGMDAEAEMLALPEETCEAFVVFLADILEGRRDLVALQRIGLPWRGASAFQVGHGAHEMLFAARCLTGGELEVMILHAAPSAAWPRRPLPLVQARLRAAYP